MSGVLSLLAASGASPLTITSGGVSSTAVVNSSYAYTSGTTNITVSKTCTVNIIAIGGGGGGTSVECDSARGPDYGGAGGGGGGYTTGTSVQLVQGTTYQAIIGAGASGGCAPGWGSYLAAGGATYFRISGSTIYVQVNGGTGGGYFNGANFVGGQIGRAHV